MIQFRFHNIHISDQARLAMINMPLKQHHIDICQNKIAKSWPFDINFGSIKLILTLVYKNMKK